MFANTTCVATTGDKFCRTIADSNTARLTEKQSRNLGRDEGSESNFFREALFSADGTSIITYTQDQCLRTFILPPELLDGALEAHALEAYSTFASPSNIQSYALYPLFSLQDASSTLVLSSSADQPLRLSNALEFEMANAKYLLTHPYTEERIRASSLAFTPDGEFFIAGSKSQLSVFDTSRDGSEPILQHRSGKSKNAANHSMWLTGLVSAMAQSPADGLLAAGTTARQVGIFPQGGRGKCAASFSIASEDESTISGNGITKLVWSPCGTYLIVAERKSDGMQVYDVRNMLRRVSWLSGRKAQTLQRLGVDVVNTAVGYEVWAGGTDGCVRMWTNPGRVEGDQECDGEVEMHGDAVSGTVWHPQGVVMATCSGSRGGESDGSESEDGMDVAKQRTVDVSDNTLKVWTI